MYHRAFRSQATLEFMIIPIVSIVVPFLVNQFYMARIL